MLRVGVKRARASRSRTIHDKINDDVCGFHPVLYATLILFPTASLVPKGKGLWDEASLAYPDADSARVWLRDTAVISKCLSFCVRSSSLKLH